MGFQLVWIFKAIQVAGAIAKWSETALADGKVSLSEGIELLGTLGQILGLPLELEIPGVTVPEKLETVMAEESTPEQPTREEVPQE